MLLASDGLGGDQHIIINRQCRAHISALFSVKHQASIASLARCFKKEPAARILAGDPLSLAEPRGIIAAVARGEPSSALVLIMTYLFVLQVSANTNWLKTLRANPLARHYRDTLY